MIDILPGAFWVVFAAAIGAIVGSFLNVCIYRLPLKMSIVWPASRCPQCGRELSWYENIPVASFLALGGRCRTCRAPIGTRYPIVEVLTSAMFALAWWHYGPGPLLASRLIFGCLLLVLFATDLEHQLLPHRITMTGVAVGFGLSFLTAPGWFDSLIGILLGAGLLYGVAEAWLRLRHREGLGGGDPPMLGMIGAFLGWKMTLVTLTLGSLIGTVVGLVLIGAGRGSLASKLPFGCFLALGAAAAATVGPALLDWYLRAW